MVYTHKKRRNNQRPSLFVKRWIWVTNGAYHLPTHIKNTCMFNQPLYWAAIILPDIGWLSSELVKHLYRKNSKGHCKAVPQQGTATTLSTNPYQPSKTKKTKTRKRQPCCRQPIHIRPPPPTTYNQNKTNVLKDLGGHQYLIHTSHTNIYHTHADTILNPGSIYASIVQKGSSSNGYSEDIKWSSNVNNPSSLRR